MRKLLIVLFLGVSLASWSQQPLIGIKDGNWIILKKGEQTKLPVHYYDVGNFDQMGFAYFATNGKYGVIDANGQEVVKPIYNRLISFGWGYFGGIKENGNSLLRVRPESYGVTDCTNWNQLDEFWAVFKGEEDVIYNFSSDVTITLDSTTTLEDHTLGYLSIAYQDSLVVYDPSANVVDLTGGSASFQEEYLRLKSNSMDQLVLPNRTFNLPEDVRRFNYDGNYFQYSTNSRTVRMDLFGKTQMDVPFGNIEKIGFDKYKFLDKGLWGIMDRKGNVVLPAKYYLIRPGRKGYFVTGDGGQGLISDAGNEIVPCQFESINKQGDLYIVETEANLFGVYSSRRQKMIVSPKFRKVTVSNDRIRGWFGETLQIAFYDSEHEIEKTITLNNTVSRFKLAKESQGFDSRLLTVGWFFEEKPIFDNEGFNVGTKRKWGIKDAGDSVLAKPRFPDPKYIPTANFSMIPIGAQESEFMGKKIRKDNIYSLMDLTTGRVMPGEFLQIDTTDALSRDYMRYSSTTGFGYITRDNKLHPVLHFDRENDPFVRFTTSQSGGFTVVETEERESVRLSTYALNNPDNPQYATWTYNDKTYNYVVLPEAKWNFLKPDGDVLVEEPFDYADRFFLNTAIVRRESGWGVINPDTTVIDCQYNRVERMKEFNDTVFLVRKSQGGFRFLNRTANEVPGGLTRVLKSKKTYTIVESGRNQMVLNNLHEVISDEGDRYRALNDRYFMTRLNRKSYVYDSEGNERAEIDAKPRDVFFDQIILYRDGSRYGLVDDRGDTLLTHDYKTIEPFGNLILAKGPDTRVFDTNGNQLFVFESEEVLIDSVTNRLAVNKSGKITIYEADGTKVTKLKGIDPDRFINNMLISLGSNGISMSILDEGPELINGIKSVESAGESGYILETKNGFSLVDLNWEPHANLSGRNFDKIRYLGEGQVYLKPGSAIYSSKYGVHQFNGRIVKDFDSGMLLTYIPEDRSYRYISPEGEDVFKQKFRDAKPFKDGYASVLMRNGWTIIDVNGLAKSLDSYGVIEGYGNGLFSTASASLYGMIDHHGNTILETKYERLKILNGDTIQAVKDGEILYFKLDGTPIEY
ncbi:MAG: hypothetical protein Crog4KO_12940 [Crocinitomicaceae bacterium]